MVAMVLILRQMIYIFTSDCLPQGVQCCHWSTGCLILQDMLCVSENIEVGADVVKAPEYSQPYSVEPGSH